MKSIGFLIATLAFTFSTQLYAESAVEFTRSLSDALNQRITQDQSLIASNPDHLEVITTETIGKHLYPDVMALNILHCKFWKKLSNTQKHHFKTWLSQKVTKHYAAMLKSDNRHRVVSEDAPPSKVKLAHGCLADTPSSAAKVQVAIGNPDSANELVFEVNLNPSSNSWQITNFSVSGIDYMYMMKKEIRSTIRSLGPKAFLQNLDTL